MCEVKLKGWQKIKTEKAQKTLGESEGSEFSSDPEMSINGGSPRSMTSGQGRNEEDLANLNVKNDVKMADQGSESSSGHEKETFSCQDLNGAGDEYPDSSPPGALWDVFRREDVQKLTEFLRREFKLSDSHSVMNDSVRFFILIFINFCCMKFQSIWVQIVEPTNLLLGATSSFQWCNLFE